MILNIYVIPFLLFLFGMYQGSRIPKLMLWLNWPWWTLSTLFEFSYLSDESLVCSKKKNFNSLIFGSIIPKNLTLNRIETDLYIRFLQSNIWYLITYLFKQFLSNQWSQNLNFSINLLWRIKCLRGLNALQERD